MSYCSKKFSSARATVISTAQTDMETRLKDYSTDINTSAHHLLQLINDILDVSNAQVGNKTIGRDEVEIEGIFETVQRIFQQRAADKGVSLDYDFGPHGARILGDAALLRRIVANLVSNGINFTPRDGKVTVSLVQSDSGGIDLVVADTGCGIATEDIPRVLTPFGQIDTSFNRENEGIGLGLTLVVAFTELHGGTVDIESELEQGTKVSARFPSDNCIV